MKRIVLLLAFIIPTQASFGRSWDGPNANLQQMTGISNWNFGHSLFPPGKYRVTITSRNTIFNNSLRTSEGLFINSQVEFTTQNSWYLISDNSLSSADSTGHKFAFNDSFESDLHVYKFGFEDIPDNLKSDDDYNDIIGVVNELR